jgi:hypothetical protein
MSYKTKHVGGRKGHVIKFGCIYIVCCYYLLDYKVIWSQTWKSNNVLFKFMYGIPDIKLQTTIIQLYDQI